MRQFLVLLVISCTVGTGWTWWAMGHMTIAQIAKNELMKMDMKIWERANNIVLTIAN